MSFREKIKNKYLALGSDICVGIDPNIDLIPQHIRVQYKNTDDLYFSFAKDIIDKTADLVLCYKIQIAYFAAVGAEDVVADLVRYIKEKGALVILDSKRGDIADTATAYAREAFERFDADAITLSPYLGFDTLEPFFSYKDRGKFVLCKTSNPGSGDLQNLKLADGKLVFEEVATRIAGLGDENIGLVVGATHLAELEAIKIIAGENLLLIPGVGKQGGDIEQIRALPRPDNNIINIGRSIIYSADIRQSVVDFSKKREK